MSAHSVALDETLEENNQNNQTQHNEDEDIELEQVRKIIYNCFIIILPNLILFISQSFQSLRLLAPKVVPEQTVEEKYKKLKSKFGNIVAVNINYALKVNQLKREKAELEYRRHGVPHYVSYFTNKNRKF